MSTELTLAAISRLLEQQRQQRIDDNRRRSREQTLASPLTQRISAAIPTDFEVQATASAASIRYCSPDEILRDMWGYFVPALGGGHTIGQQERARLLDSPETAAGLDALNRGQDAVNMRRLEAAIRAWAQGDQTEPYVDPEASHGGTPYKYGPGLFSEHGIIVASLDGELALQFVGGGYGADGVELAQRFAAFVDRPITYRGPVRLTYTLRLPSNVMDLPVREVSYWTETTLADVEVPVPVEQLVAHLSSLGTADVDEKGVLDLIAQDDSGATRPVDLATRSVRLTLHAYESERGIVTHPPSFQFKFQAADPDDQSSTVAALLAMQATRQSPEHPNGYQHRHGFTFGEAASARLREIGEQLRPAVAVREASLATDSGVSIEVFATGALPGQVVLNYVGARDPRAFADSAKATIDGLIAQQAAPASLPQIVLVGHPAGQVDESKLAAHINRDLRAAARRIDREGKEGIPASTTLLVHDPADKPALVAALRRMRLNHLESLASIIGVVPADLTEASDEEIDRLLQARKTEYGTSGEGWYRGWASAIFRPQELANAVRVVAAIDDVLPPAAM